MDAIECYDKALEIDPNYTLAQNNKAIVLNHLNKQNS
jgi:lipoprotein NlpI